MEELETTPRYNWYILNKDTHEVMIHNEACNDKPTTEEEARNQASNVITTECKAPNSLYISIIPDTFISEGAKLSTPMRQILEEKLEYLRSTKPIAANIAGRTENPEQLANLTIHYARCNAQIELLEELIASIPVEDGTKKDRITFTMEDIYKNLHTIYTGVLVYKGISFTVSLEVYNAILNVELKSLTIHHDEYDTSYVSHEMIENQ